MTSSGRIRRLRRDGLPEAAWSVQWSCHRRSDGASSRQRPSHLVGALRDGTRLAFAVGERGTRIAKVPFAVFSIYPRLAAAMEAGMLSAFTMFVWIPAIVATPTPGSRRPHSASLGR
jgi:hypothetical protein